MRKLLVANRGEIARRIMRTARSMGIGTVAVFSDPDDHAPHVREADQSVRLPGSSAASTYLAIDGILEAARLTGADAIHPGYGFLSENASFARACGDAGITFIGPSATAIETMGSKVAAKQLMAAAGVPVLGEQGFPLLVKAAFGGGGRGMRIVRDPADLDAAVSSARREAEAAFGDGTVFLERYVDNPRHIEVQIFGDQHDNVVHLFERECSIQRRYQKVIEESPSPAVSPQLRESLCSAAVAAGRALNYVGAGTVEFILDPSGEFFFLEVNTRLQVEHPVTELVTGLDLVELQIRVARGEALNLKPRVNGHAIEARLYAEDVGAGFVPASGRIERLRFPALAGIRVDSGYEEGSTVSTFYDAMIAKVISYAPTRDEAAVRLGDALAATRIHGVPTNRQLLVSVLRHPEFLAGQTDTGFLERHDPVALSAPSCDALHPVAAALAGQAERKAAHAVQPSIPSGWRNVRSELQQSIFAEGERRVEVGYGFTREGMVIEVDGAPVDDVHLWHATPTEVELSVRDVRRRYEVHRVASRVYVDDVESSSEFDIVERLPSPVALLAAGSMVAPLPGAVVRILVAPGDQVAVGQVLLVLEAMKMEHSIMCAQPGTITEVLVAVGEQVDGGQVLVVLAADDD